MTGIVSRKTRELCGGFVGSRNAGDSAIALSDGTVRPVCAAIRWPSGPSANSMNFQAASLWSEASAMQYASECRIPAGSRWTGSGATSHSKSVIVRKVGVERRDESTMASRPFWNRVSSSSASTSSSEGTTKCTCRRSKNCCMACWASGVSSVKRVGLSRSSTISPPFDHVKGATRMIVGSMPRPCWSMSPSPFRSRVSRSARCTMSFHVHPAAG